MKTNFSALQQNVLHLPKAIARLTRFNGNTATYTKSSKFAFGNETYGVILNQTGFKTYAPGLHQFFNFFPDASSRLDLSVTMLNMAERLAETGMVLP